MFPLQGPLLKFKCFFGEEQATCGSESNVLEVSEGNGSGAQGGERATQSFCPPSHTPVLLRLLCSSALGDKGCWEGDAGIGSALSFCSGRPKEIHSKQPSATAKTLSPPGSKTLLLEVGVRVDA